MSYLSIDLDYWIPYNTTQSANRFFRKIFNLNVPILVVKHHQYLCNDVNTNPPKDKILYNVDYHSDVTSESYIHSKRLNCGTWVDFIKWRRKGLYMWIYPNKNSCFTNYQGICDNASLTTRLPFEPYTITVNNRQYNYNQNKWKEIRHIEGLRNVKLNTVERVGIAISPDYYNLTPVYDIMDMLINRSLPDKTRLPKTDNEYNAVKAAASQFHPYKYLDSSYYNVIKPYLNKLG